MKNSVGYLSVMLLLGSFLFSSQALGGQASGRFNMPAKKLYALVVKMLQEDSAVAEKVYKVPNKTILNEENLSLGYGERCDDIERNPGKCVYYDITIIPDSASTSTVQVEANDNPRRSPDSSNAEMLLIDIRSKVLNEKNAPKKSE